MLRTLCSLLSTKKYQWPLPLQITNGISRNVFKTLKPVPSVNLCLWNLNNISVSNPVTSLFNNYAKNSLIKPQLTVHNQIRTLIKFSWKKGKRKTVNSVLRRFYRLNWGIWIHPKAGRHRLLWKKTARRKCRLREHAFCNARQSRMLDTMVSKFWRKPKYYIKSPYEPYEWREEFEITRRRHWRPEGCDYE